MDIGDLDILDEIKSSTVHIRIQQRNGRKCITTIQGIEKELGHNRILKALRKKLAANGTVIHDPDLGDVLQLQGDQRKEVNEFLIYNKIYKSSDIHVHGF
jgi:translation initiation factor 1